MILERKILSNKLETFFINSKGSATATIQIWFKSGSSHEKDKKDYGIAHFLEHMFFKGTKKYPGAKLAYTIESFGGEVNAFTSFDYTCYYINAPSKYIEQSLDVLLEMVSYPTFLESEIIPERNVVFEEYRRSLDSASQYNFFKIQQSCFAGGYQHPILGTEKNILNFNREQLIRFRESFYNVNNSFLVVAGDLDKQKKIEHLINSFSLPDKPRPLAPQFSLKKTSKLSSHEKATNQTTVNFTIEAPAQNTREAAIEDLALNCLTYGDISPLYKKLVTKTKLASSIGGSTMFFNHKGCHFLRTSMPVDNLERVLNGLETELIKVLEQGFSKEEIDRIRNQYISSKIYEKESIESYAFSVGHAYAQTSDVESEDKFLEHMKTATGKDVHKALLNIFSRFIHINIQYPENKTHDQEVSLTSKFSKNLKNAIELIKKEKKDESIFTSSKFDPSVKSIEIAKNVKLLYRKNIMTPTFVFHTYLKGGLAFETEENNGIYNLIAKNLTYGHKDLDYERLKILLESKSAYLSSFSGKNAYGLTLHGLSDNFTELTEHFFNTLEKPSFPSSYLKLEKELLKRTLHLQKEDPIKHCFQSFNKMVFNNHPYAMNMVGSEKSIRKITRKDLIETHNMSLNESEIVFTYCGDKELEEVQEVINKYITHFKPRKKLIKKNPKIKPFKNQKELISFDREQTHIVIGKSAFSISQKEDLHLKMFTTYLSGQSSELFVEVRDRMGLCYSCQPLHQTAMEGGYWGIYIGAGHDKKDQAIKAILDIIKKYQEKGISKKEFARIKKMIMGQNLLGVQTNDDYAGFYSIPLLHNLGLDFQHETLEEINSLTKEDFNRFLSKYLQGDWNIVEVGR